MATVAVTSGGRECVKEAAQLLSKVFGEDPVITYMLSSMGHEARLAYLPKYFDSLLTAAAMNNAVFHEVGGWRGCGVLMPPGYRVDNIWTMLPAGFIPMLWKIGIGGCQRMLSEYQPLADALKVKALAGEKKYYYVFFVGTHVAERRKGLCSVIMRKYQEIASRDQLPIFLEATTETSMRLYLKLGWEVIDEIVLGKGKAGVDGVLCRDGEGLKIWGMVWKPDKT